MTTSSTAPASTATGSQEPSKPSAPAAPSVTPAPQASVPAAKKEINPYEGDSRYAQYKIVRLRLLREGILQYDPSFPELQLTCSAPEGQLLPLTPFFASRINQTLELVI